MGNSSFDRIYKDVPREHVERLLGFRAAHPVKTLAVGGRQWRYLVGGRGEEVLVIIHGVTGTLESPFRQMMMFEETYRVIAPTYPVAAKSAADIVEGIVALLEAEAVPAAHVLGISLGGAVAQLLVRQRPMMVSKLILSHTVVPTPGVVRSLERRLRLVSLLPSRYVLAVARRRFHQRLTADAGDMEPAERAFWFAFGDETYSCSLAKGDLLARLKVHIDFHRNYRFEAGELADWPGDILIVESDGDEIVPPAMREALKALYPQARVHTFHGVGHASGLIKTEENVSVIRGFLGVEMSSRLARRA